MKWIKIKTHFVLLIIIKSRFRVWIEYFNLFILFEIYFIEIYSTEIWPKNAPIQNLICCGLRGPRTHPEMMIVMVTVNLQSQVLGLVPKTGLDLALSFYSEPWLRPHPKPGLDSGPHFYRTSGINRSQWVWNSRKPLKTSIDYELSLENTFIG